MVPEGVGKSSENGGCPGCAVCGAMSLVVAVFGIAIAYSLVVSTLTAVPELATAAVVYVFFLVWGVVWLVLTAGYQRVTRSNGHGHPR